METTTIGNGYEVLDARDFVPMSGSYFARDFAQVERISVHHSAVPGPLPVAAELDALTAIGRYHIFGNNWPGFAYHFAIAPSGNTYYTGDIRTTRYIVGPDNPFNVGICLLGNFMDHSPTPAALEALRLLIGEIQFERGKAIPYYGHRDTPDTAPTACPGDWYKHWLPTLSDVGDDVASVRIWSRDEIVAALVAAADEREVPRRMLLGGAIAESNLGQFSERWGTWPDVSFGIGHQTVRFAPVGDKSSTAANIRLVREWLFDPANAIPLMADKLAASFKASENPGTTEDERIHWALFKYNAGSFKRPPERNVANYERGLAAADALLAEMEDDVDREALTAQLGAIWGNAEVLETSRPSRAVLARIAADIKAAVIAAKDAARLT